MAYIGKTIAKHIILLIYLSAVGCSSLSVNTKNFEETRPRSIGVVVGYDVSAKQSLSASQEIFVAFTFGIPGVIYASATAEKYALSFIDKINADVSGRIVEKLEKKGYKATLLKLQPNEWKLFDYVSDKEGVYQALLDKYGIDDTAGYDALLFFEYLCVGRYEGYFRADEIPEPLRLDNMKLKYLKSKIMVYAINDHKRLYFDMVQKGYPSTSSSTFPEKLDVLVPLAEFPAAR